MPEFLVCYVLTKRRSLSGQPQREIRSISSWGCWFFVSGFAAGRTLRPPSGRACFRRAGGAANSPLRSSFFSNTSHPPSLPYNKMYFLPDFNRFPAVYISHHFCMTVQAVYFPEKPANLGTIHLGIPENTSHPAYHSLSELHFPCILYGSGRTKEK